MKTFLEQLQKAVGIEYPLRDILNNLTYEEIITEVNLFAKNVAKEALANASVNAKVAFDGNVMNCHFNDDYGRLTEILPDTITDENNIPI